MIELDLVPWLMTRPTAPTAEVGAVYTAVAGRIYYASAPEFVVVSDKKVRTPYPYIYLEGPIHFDDNRINEGSSLRAYTGIRLWCMGNNMTEVSTILGLIHTALGSLQNLTIGSTYVQAFFCEDKWVDNRQAQRGKQEKDPEASEDPMASGHIDYNVLCSP